MKNISKFSWIFLILVLIFFFYTGWQISPGAFSKAERYEFEVSEDSLISIVKTIKQENPDLILPESIKMPDGSLIELKDGRDSTSYWYKIYFYYPEKDQILLTWTRSHTKEKTIFAFAGINSFKKEWGWKPPNESFWWWKNQPDIDEFEQRILQKINAQLNSNP